MPLGITVTKGNLSVYGQLPHKDGTPGRKQQKIATGLKDDTKPNGERGPNWAKAQKVLKKVERELKNGTFEWSNYSQRVSKDGPRWSDAIRLLYEKKVTNGKTKQNTWDVNYMGSLRRLDPSEPVTPENMVKVMEKWGQETYSYKKVYYLMRDIAYLLSMEFPIKKPPLYSSATVAIREVPSDQEIVQWVLSAPQPYRWFWGMAATYGLRPHEIEVSKMIQKDYLQVPDGTKTGFRTVVPLHREWVELFDLRNKQDRAPEWRDSKKKDAVSRMLGKELEKQGATWTNYSLRHAFAGRLWNEGGADLDVYTAARLMGHSVKVHTDTYRAFIDPHQVAVAAEKAFASNRSKVAKRMEEALQS